MSLRKLCCLLLTALCLYLPGRAVQAAAVPAPDDSAYLPQVLELLAGDWYDGDGQLVLSLNDTYLNQCPVTGLHGLAGRLAAARVNQPTAADVLAELPQALAAAATAD